ncbi:MAG: hypothetical protein ACLQVA_16670 [Candidatus Brocadiia bacterium]
MRPKPEKERVMAESLFIVEGKSSREIAGLLGMGKETVQRWARDGKWMDRRRLRRSESPLASLERLRRERDRLIGQLGGADPSGDPPAAEEPAGEKPAAEQPLAPEAVSDTIGLIHKLTQTIEKMESRREDESMEPHREEDSIGAMLTTMERFAEFVGSHGTDEERRATHSIVEKFLDAERQKCL